MERYTRYTIWIEPHTEGMMSLEVDATDPTHLEERVSTILNPGVEWDVAGVEENGGLPKSIPLTDRI